MFKIRKLWQFFFFFLANGYWGFLWKKGLYRGWPKHLCFPGLNCYSCPAATMACPLGSLQQSLAALRVLPNSAYKALIYVTSFLLLVILLLGRLVCGWICPFGFFQELLFKIPFFSKKKTPLSWSKAKYILLIVLVLILPWLWIGPGGYGEPWFCKLICPAGTLEAGVFNLILRPELRSLIGYLFWSKLFFLILLFILCMKYLRFFCVVLCPLGAIYGCGQRWSFFKLSWEPQNCLDCKICEEICPIGLKIPENLNSSECIRCLKCVKVCSSRAIKISFNS